MARNQISRTFQKRILTTVRTGYLLFLPGEYPARRTTRWPLIFFLHGSGERGTSINKVATHGPPKIVKADPGFPFILVSPQCPSGKVWSPRALLALLDEVVRRHRVDHSRIYLTGMSMGGYGTWELGLRHPERFAAIAPVCGGGDILSVLLADPRRTRRLKHLPIWAFHGAKDELVPLAESERMVKALTQLGNTPRLTVYPEAGHDSWTETYGNPALYEWFLQQRHPGLSPDGKPRRH